MRPVPSRPLVAPFATRLLAADLPALSPDRRDAAVAFTVRRVEGLPSVMHAGVLMVAAIVRVVLLVPGGIAGLRMRAVASVPVLGEYVRLVRSLGYAYVWEHWPDTGPDGAAA